MKNSEDRKKAVKEMVESAEEALNELIFNGELKPSTIKKMDRTMCTWGKYKQSENHEK